MSTYILAIDQGTTGSTALVIDKDARVLAKINREYPQHYPQPGWVEHEPEEIWSSVEAVIKEALAAAGVAGTAIAAIGITNQRETTVIWERETGRAIHPAIVWQDRRTANTCLKLRKNAALVRKIRQTTGLVLDPYFSATKIKWILDNVPGALAQAKAGKLAFGTIDSFLLWRLTHGAVHATDVTNASRTLLCNIKTLSWDASLAKTFGVPMSVLPKIHSSSEIYGRTKGLSVLPDGIPIAGIAGDQQAALFGQLCFTPGEAKCTYGTGSFLVMNVGAKPLVSKSGLLTTVAWQVGKEVNYALEGSSFIAGAAVQWLRDELKIISKSSEIEALAASVADSGGVSFVPALAGLGAPHWDPNARGLLCGLTRGSGRAQIARAVLEGIALSQADILRAMQKDSGKKLKKLKVDGGASANVLLMQFQSDVLSCAIERPAVVETTALGAAYLAGLAIGYWHSRAEIAAKVKTDRTFVPRMQNSERKSVLEKWDLAVKRAKL